MERCHTEGCSQPTSDSELEGCSRRYGGVEEEVWGGLGPKTGLSAIEEEIAYIQIPVSYYCEFVRSLPPGCLLLLLVFKFTPFSQ
jgi:hypothetical protein